MSRRAPRPLRGGKGGPESVADGEERPGGGLLVVVSGPSGVGKGAIVEGAMDRLPTLQRSVSVTTRAARPGEAEGAAYYFRSREEFQRMVERGEMLEHATYLGECYGTPRAEADRGLEAGRPLVFEVDVVGARSLREHYPRAVLIFVAPPSWEALAARLRARSSETPRALARRLKVARGEVQCADEYDYVIINDRLEEAVDLFCSIIQAEGARPWRTDLSPLRPSRARR